MSSSEEFRPIQLSKAPVIKVQDWARITTSASGQYVYASTFSNYIYKSSDYGKSWIISYTTSDFKNYNPIATDNSGQYVHVGVGEKVTGPIYRSQDKGVSWEMVCVCWNDCDSDGGDWMGIALSGDGKYIYATAVAADSCGGIWKSEMYGNGTWTNITPRHTNGTLIQGWRGISTSKDGKYVFSVIDSAGEKVGFTDSGIYVNNNYGMGPFVKTVSDHKGRFQNVASSYSGQNVYVTQGVGAPDLLAIYCSYNYGQTFSFCFQSDTESPNSIATNAEGDIIYAVIGDYLYKAENYAKSKDWQVIYSASNTYSCIATSSSGQHVYATVSNGEIYTSSNFGTNWTVYGPSHAPSKLPTFPPSTVPSFYPTTPTSLPTSAAETKPTHLELDWGAKIAIGILGCAFVLLLCIVTYFILRYQSRQMDDEYSAHSHYKYMHPDNTSVRSSFASFSWRKRSARKDKKALASSANDSIATPSVYGDRHYNHEKDHRYHPSDRYRYKGPSNTIAPNRRGNDAVYERKPQTNTRSVDTIGRHLLEDSDVNKEDGTDAHDGHDDNADTVTEYHSFHRTATEN